MFDVKANFKTKYQGILLHCYFCKIDEESIFFVCPDNVICKCSDVSGHLQPKRHWTTTETGLVFAEI